MSASRKRLIIGPLVAVGLLPVCLAGKLAYDVGRLSSYRDYIERRYEREISLIERTCMELPEGEPSIDEMREELKIAEALGQSLQSSAIYSASWSNDGHHGAQYLKRPTGGGSTSCWKFLARQSPDGNGRIFYGRSFDHQRLLIYERWVLHGRKRHYSIEFLLDAIQGEADRE